MFNDTPNNPFFHLIFKARIVMKELSYKDLKINLDGHIPLRRHCYQVIENECTGRSLNFNASVENLDISRLRHQISWADKLEKKNYRLTCLWEPATILIE